MDPTQAAGLGQDPSGSAAPLMDAMGQQLQGSQTMFDKMEGGKKLLGRARTSLDQLKSLGDNVSPDDVVDMGGALVGAGLNPSAVAGLLSSMPPEGGQSLAGWVGQQDQSLRQREQLHEQVHSAMQHHLGVNAMRMLAGHHLGQASEQVPPDAAAPAGLGLN